jgi:hypothetical protein
MAKPTPRSPEQELKDAQARQTQATKELALHSNDQKLADSHGPLFVKALAAFEGVLREAKATPEDSLVIAAAVENNVKKRLLRKCGGAVNDSIEETTRVDSLHAAVHELSAMGRRMEKRVVDNSPVIGVGRMVLPADKSKGG